MVSWSTNATNQRFPVLVGCSARHPGLMSVCRDHSPSWSAQQMSRAASLLSGEDNEPVALPIDRLLCCFAGQTNQRRHNLQVLSVSRLLPAPCAVQFDTHLSWPLTGALMNSLGSARLCLYSVIFCCDRSAAAEKWWHWWTSENDERHLFGSARKILIDFGEALKFTPAPSSGQINTAAIKWMFICGCKIIYW